MQARPGSEAEQALKGEPHNPKPSAKLDAERKASNTSDNTASEIMRTPGRNPSAADSTRLVAEKYLYGQGVRQDCNRALALLRPAADSNVKARSLLGAMYATGHCVPRDLPRSYHWFALALREEPNNVWVSRNLQSVWNQMSDSEKQLATRMTK
jgi:TPR repeat protein